VSERDIDQEQVRKEHLEEVKPIAHWAYLVAVLGGGLVGMLVLIAWLGSATG
jgi:hypothetical protein